jgi:YjbE family integral membrane protein
MTGSMLDAEFWLRLGGIILIDLTLAGDNALVIALAVRTLPARLRLIGRIWGTAGAIILRVAFIFVATWLLKLPFLQAVGGLMLVWIAVKLVRPQPVGEDGHGVREASSLREAIWIIIVADAAMSLDNVLAVAGTAKGEMVLVVIGIALSLPLVVFGSALLSFCMERWPWVIWLGGGVLGYVAGDMVMRDVGEWLLVSHGWSIAVSCTLGAVIAALGWWFQRAGRRGAIPREA